MSRVKGGVSANKRRKYILENTKGFHLGRGTKKREAIEATHHAQLHAFAHRKDKKNVFRRVWTTRINAILRENGQKYSIFMKTLKDKGIIINRKMLATIAKNRPEVFLRILSQAK